MSQPALEDYVTRMRPSTASNLLLWLVAGFVLIFIVWASLTHLDRTVRGQGRIIPSSQLQIRLTTRDAENHGGNCFAAVPAE